MATTDTALPKRIVVATDFTEQADLAVAHALSLAQRLDARVQLVHTYVVPMPGPPDLGGAFIGDLAVRMAADAERSMQDALARHRRPGVEVSGVVKEGDARDQIIEVAKAFGADLIVIGSHGRRGFKRLVMGSVAEMVVRHAPCPVLVVRPKEAGAA